jgi:cell division protein FtsB
MAKRKNFISRLVILVIFTVALAFLFFNENGILKYAKMKNEIKQLNEKIVESEQRLQILDSEIDSLKNSMMKIEKVARERYNMMLPDESEIKIEEN